MRGERPGSIWQWPELLELIPKLGAISFAVHQCQFGASTPKPTRFLTNMEVDDPRCYCALPKFDKFGFYKGPLPKHCGHEHTAKLIGKTGATWNTAPSASYPPLLCQFLSELILHAKASCGSGFKDELVLGPSKRRKFLSAAEQQVGQVEHPISGASAVEQVARSIPGASTVGQVAHSMTDASTVV